MDEDTEDRTGVAGAIFASGWRQCSIFRPPAEGLQDLGNLNFDPAREWLVVCTQTCSLCSENISAEPTVEVMVATPLLKFNPKHNDAMGKNNKCLHVPVRDFPNVDGLACHMGRRTFVSKAALAGWKPSRGWMEERVEKSFRGWLAHHYLRVSLPDRLVDRLRLPDGVRDSVMHVLQAKVSGRSCAEGVASFYIDWEPNEDIAADKPYIIELLVACKDEETREFMTHALSDLHAGKRDGLSVHGVIVAELELETEDNITLTMLEGMHRFNEWDELSSLPERLESMEKSI
jgi:hypothetical protein